MLCAHGEGEESGLLRVARHLELGKGSCMSLDGLAHFPLHRVQLHVASHSVLLGGEAKEDKHLSS